MQRRTRTIITLLCSALVGTSIASGGGSVDEIEGRIIDRDLVEHHGRPLVFEGGDFLAFDRPSGVSEVVPYGRVEVIVVGETTYRGRDATDRRVAERAGDLDPISAPFLETTDGQRIPGDLVRTGDGRVLWRSAWLPSQPLDPERISRLRLVRDADVPIATDADVVVLANGDRIEGFVDSIGPSVVLEIVDGDRAGELFEVPIDRVASISLSNPSNPGSGVMAWFRGGHRILGSEIRIEDDGYTRLMRPVLGGDQAEIPSEYFMAAIMNADRVRPWASLRWRQSSGDVEGVRPWIPPIERAVGHHPLDAAPLRVRGAMKASATTPWPGARYRVVVERDPDAGPGRSVFVVRDGDLEVSRHEIDHENPVVVATGTITGNRIDFELENGDDGPFEDEIVLREAIIIRSGE